MLASWSLAALAIAFLYFGRSVLIPITLASFLSFLLAPVVALLRRMKVPRAISVVLAMLIALGVISATAMVLVGQAAVLKGDAPAYADRIIKKAERAREDLQQRFAFSASVRGQRHKPSDTERANAIQQTANRNAAAAQAMPVSVKEADPPVIEQARTYLMPLVAPIETGLIVLVVTLFFMFQKEDVRDRVIRLMGPADLHRTTIALDDAANRLSRYFLSQAIVNALFGAVIWLGLWLLGIPAAGLWGVLAGLLRFVPYVGIFIAAIGPVGLGAAVAPGLGLAGAVAALFLVIEPVVGYGIEPMVYGRSSGLSPVSVVVSSIFWAWIWGPVGLILAMPLTLMLVVLGRHIPAFELFDILLGDRPPLSAAETFYQRALAMRSEDALENAEDQLDHLSLSQFYDGVALPGLRLAVADVERGAVERSSLTSVCEMVVQLVAALQEFPYTPEAEPQAQTLEGISVLCVPGRGPLDRAIAAIAAHLFEEAGAKVHRLPREALSQFSRGEDGLHIDAVCILGLFSARSARRIALAANHIKSTFPGALLYVGLDRHEAADARNQPPFADSFQSLINMCVAGHRSLPSVPH
jgi:predicted PurR-regulated permease PerM